jgi:hypothetical protein
LDADGSIIKQESLKGTMLTIAAHKRSGGSLRQHSSKKQSNSKESFYQMTSLFNFFSSAAVSRVHEKEKLCHPISSSFSPTLLWIAAANS